MVKDFDSVYALAVERGNAAKATEPRALAARYEPATGKVIVDLDNGCAFIFPARSAQGLNKATDEQLSQIEVLPTGVGLHWEALDADLSVTGLVAGLFGSKHWMQELARRGGQSKSEAKANAARDNGKKGGRPLRDKNMAA